MKHILNKNPLISFFGGLAFCFVLFASCENFLNGADVKAEIEQAIAYNNAKEISVLLQPEEGTGSTLPAGNTKIKQGYDFEISFSENPAYSFVKWTAVTNDNARTTVSDGVVFENATSAVTKVKISNDTVSIRILPVCEKRIEVSGEPSPGYAAAGVSWNSPIHVEFTKALNPDSFIFDPSEIPEGAELKTNGDGKIWAFTLEGQTCFKNITITDANDLSLADYYDMPQVNGTNLTILASTVHPFEFERPDELKLIKVTLAKGITDTKNIQMTAEKSWRYQINNTTNEKASIVFANQTEGSTNVPSKDYSLGQKINISFKENEGFQFVRWDYDKSIILIEEPDSIETIALVIKPTETNTSTTIKAICAPCLTVATPYPVNDIGNLAVSKNESIRITFDHELPAEEECREQLENISIKIGSDSVKTNFKAPHIDGKTITIAADNSNLISVDKGETKTVTVTIPKDFYYEYEGKKIYAAKDYTWSYKINDTTINKTPVSFSATEEEMSGKQIRVEGTYLSSGTTKEMSVQQKWALEFPVSKGYKFDGWKLTAPVDYSVTSTSTEEGEYKKGGVISILAQDSQTQQTQTLFTLSIDSESPEKATLYAYGLITEGFTISAMETVLPVVEYVKINGLNSIYDTPSTSCDSKIYIYFNKEIKVTEGEAILDPSGYISITKVGLSTMHYENCFTTSWEDNNKTLVIKPTNKIATLVPNPTELFDFVIKLNASKEFQDKDENTLQLSSGINNSFEIGYTINGVRETTVPVVNSINLFKDASHVQEEDALYQDHFDQWTQRNFAHNHLSKSMYLNCSATDTESGVKLLRVTETVYQTLTGDEIDSTPLITTYIPSSYDSDEANFVYTHQFKTVNDGILKIDFELIDYAGNESETVSYFVAKDTTINFKDELRTYFSLEMDQGRLKGTVVDKDVVKETVHIKCFANPCQKIVYKKNNKKFYGNVYTKVLWSYREDYFNEQNQLEFVPKEDYYILTHDVSKTIYLKLILTDDIGNEQTYIRIIPASPEFVCKKDGDGFDKLVFTVKDFDLYHELNKKYDLGIEPIQVMFFWNKALSTNTTDPENVTTWNLVKNPYVLGKYYIPLGETLNSSMFIQNGEETISDGDYYISMMVNIGDVTVTDKGELLYRVPSVSSSISETALRVSVKSGKVDNIELGSQWKGAALSTNSVSALVKLCLKLHSVEHIKNSGKSKVCIKPYLPDSSVLNNYSIELRAVDQKSGTILGTSESDANNCFTIDLTTPGYYCFNLVLTSKQDGKKYATNSLELAAAQGVTLDPKVCTIDEETLRMLKLTGDCNPPVFAGDSIQENTFPFAFNMMYRQTEGATAFAETEEELENLKPEITYWILPNPNRRFSLYSTFSEQELAAYPSKTITFDSSLYDKTIQSAYGSNQLRVELPYDDLDEGLYTICIKATDKNNNYSYYFQPVFNRLLNEKLKYSLIGSTRSRIQFVNEHTGMLESVVFYYYDVNTKRWVYCKRNAGVNDVLNNHDKVDIPSYLSGRWARFVGFKGSELSYDLTSYGYYDIEYVYLDYLIKKGTNNEIVVTQKNILTGLNGLQVYCDAPTLAHTLYCSKKLSETATENDIAVWENKGVETGVVIYNSNFTYGNDQYADVPSSYYYTTVIHFADGTKVMSEVKQK